MIDEKTLGILADALGGSDHEIDDDVRAQLIVEMLAAKDIHIVNWGPGKMTLMPGEPLKPIISARDMFAGEAFSVFMTRIGNIDSIGSRRFAISTVQEFAKFSYEAADIMIEARDASPQVSQVWPVWTVKKMKDTPETEEFERGNTYVVLAPNNLWYGVVALSYHDAAVDIKKSWIENQCSDLTAINYIDTSDIAETDEEWFKRAKIKKSTAPANPEPPADWEQDKES